MDRVCRGMQAQPDSSCYLSFSFLGFLLSQLAHQSSGLQASLAVIKLRRYQATLIRRCCSQQISIAFFWTEAGDCHMPHRYHHLSLSSPQGHQAPQHILSVSLLHLPLNSWSLEFSQNSCLQVQLLVLEELKLAAILFTNQAFLLELDQI